MSELLINTTSDIGDYKLQVNGNVYTNGYLSINSNDIWIQSGGQGILSPNASRIISIQNGAVEIGGTIKTAAPSGFTAQPWKLGDVTVTSITVDTDKYVSVDINGTVYNIPTCHPN